MGSQRGRPKKLLRAFRFACNGQDPEHFCEKDAEGNCNGRSTLRWQDWKGHYTWDCPYKLITDYADLLNVYFRWKRYGLHDGPTYPEEPALYIFVIDMLDAESGRLKNG